MNVITILPMTADHWEGVWAFMEPIFRAGESYPVGTDVTESQARDYWCSEGRVTYVALDAAGLIVGSYYIRPNQPTLGAHICNAGYLVAEAARGQGVASAMCKHSQSEALAVGYTGMQYNLVVVSNKPAVRLWTKMGFEIIGTVPKAFNHKTLGFVDANIMFKALAD